MSDYRDTRGGAFDPVTPFGIPQLLQVRTETVVNGRATQAKVVFDDGQYGVFDVLNITRV